jgi:hypothetical protein
LGTGDNSQVKVEVKAKAKVKAKAEDIRKDSKTRLKNKGVKV